MGKGCFFGRYLSNREHSLPGEIQAILALLVIVVFSHVIPLVAMGLLLPPGHRGVQLAIGAGVFAYFAFVVGFFRRKRWAWWVAVALFSLWSLVATVGVVGGGVALVLGKEGGPLYGNVYGILFILLMGGVGGLIPLKLLFACRRAYFHGPSDHTP